MSPTCRSILLVFAFATATAACGTETAGTGGTATGSAGRGMTGPAGSAGAGATTTTGTSGTGGAGGMTGPMGTGGKMMKPMPMGTAGTGAIIVGIPTPGQPGTVFPGGGPNGNTSLKPGCTPASAHECPSASGTCATSATSNPTGTTTGSVCFYGPITTTT